ncbi:SFT2-like protein [Mya arenaria]|uniref:Vesicle transport protein n=1 Tax=Mya arenaria TaxID=6604 RepID=A0ABY7F2D6_MYAAR|nr:SFT2-like protein [Mya arenaria]
MANLSQNLKDYMSKSQSKEPLLLTENESSGSFSFSKLNPFRKSQIDSYEDTNAVANGWFSQAQKDPFFPGLSKKQRILGFACLYIPMLVLKARKFAMLYTLGSLFIICSFSMLWGPWNHIKHLFSQDRLPFSLVYFGTMFATIYFSIWVRSTVMTVHYELYTWWADRHEVFLESVLCCSLKDYPKCSPCLGLVVHYILVQILITWGVLWILFVKKKHLLCLISGILFTYQYTSTFLPRNTLSTFLREVLDTFSRG